MKRSQVVVPWHEGLHFRPAGRLVRVAREFRSTVFLRCGVRVADIRSILGIVALCAVLGTTIEIEAVGEDEQDAVVAVERVFSPDSDSGDSAEVV